MIYRQTYAPTCAACHGGPLDHDDVHYGRCYKLTRAEYQRLASRLAVGLKAPVGV